MAVRLNKALKELNVGINTVAEFLQKKGLALQDATPNAKITDEQYALLQKEFGEDMKQNAETKQKIQNQKVKEQQEKKERQQAAREEKERLEKERLEKEKAAKKPQLKIVGNINDLKKEEPKPKQEVKTEVEPKSADPAPKEETPVVETKKKDKRKKNAETSIILFDEILLSVLRDNPDWRGIEQITTEKIHDSEPVALKVSGEEGDPNKVIRSYNLRFTVQQREGVQN